MHSVTAAQNKQMKRVADSQTHTHTAKGEGNHVTFLNLYIDNIRLRTVDLGQDRYSLDPPKYSHVANFSMLYFFYMFRDINRNLYDEIVLSKLFVIHNLMFSQQAFTTHKSMFQP